MRRYSAHLCRMKNAIITGSSKGLGRSIAEELSQQGYRVWLSSRKESELKEAKEEIEKQTGNPVQIRAIDFTDQEDVIRYAKEILDACESIDLLVNNVGTYIPDRLDEGDAHLDFQMALNFQAPYALTQALINRFKSQKTGHIFNVCSVVNRKPRVDAASYTISKFALWGYHKVLHQTLLPLGVKVTAFFPSSIATSSWDGMDAPFDEFVQPEDIASMISNILSLKRGTVPSEIDLVAINPDF